VRRTRKPLSPNHGAERGSVIDRYYIERFLERYRADVTGRCLEVKDRMYTERFGHDVTRSDVLDVDPGNPLATIVGDLRRLDGVPADTFDCFVLTQTLHLIDDMQAAVGEAHRIVKPGGVVLATMPATIVRLAHNYDDYWRVTPLGARFLFGRHFPDDALTVEAYGNVVAGLAFWMGKAREELRQDELDFEDPLHPLVVGVRAIKPPR
jgi:SAM-dependent methyltransferase